MLLDSKIISKLSSAGLSKVNTGSGSAGERARTVRNQTNMTVSHDEATRGVHVHLQREFRFVSPPGPEPAFMRPRRSNTSTERLTVGDAPTEGEGLSLTEGDVVDQMERGQGKAVEEASKVIQHETEGAMGDGIQTSMQSQDEPEGGSTTPIFRNKDQIPRNDTQQAEAAEDDANQPAEACIEASGAHAHA